MDAILLAAGLGTRLRPHTLTTPKPLLPVQDRPILDWTLGALPSSIDRVIVVVHYLAEQIEAYLAIQSHIPKYAIVEQTEPKGTGDAVRACKDHVQSDRFLILNGDDLYGAEDLAKLSSCQAGLLVQPVNEPEKFGIVFQNSNGSLKELREKPKGLNGTFSANIGAYILPKKIFDIELTLSERGEYELTQYIGDLAKTDTVDVLESKFWFPIGTEEAWNKAQHLDLTQVLTT